MSSDCKTCSAAVNGIEKVACRGNCGSVFHRTCIPGLYRSVLETLANYEQNLFWLCNDCASSFNNWLHKPVAASTAGEINMLKDAVSKLNDVVTNLSGRIEKYFPHGHTPAAVRGLAISRPYEDQPTPKRRRDDDVQIRATTTAVRGTRTIQREIKTVNDERDQFWIYLSRLDPCHSVDDIIAMTQECLVITNSPKVILLVKKDANLSKLNFVSFRVEVPNELKDLALEASTWPTGVLVRKFDFDQGKSSRFRQ
ncbi:uncharacterized protein LOC128736159 [Sabethes cyaneus]|uniref:uncharacterized protein LOC128736159 n=1 Tax=Sabethes cyaneus TaxID=53552 RepID=UPI00237D3708|nr:uncharacterized protein LOC128736159 [Sabethes cyaneus]